MPDLTIADLRRICAEATSPRPSAPLPIAPHMAWERQHEDYRDTFTPAVLLPLLDELAAWRTKAASPVDLSAVLGYELGADRLAAVERERDDALRIAKSSAHEMTNLLLDVKRQRDEARRLAGRLRAVAREAIHYLSDDTAADYLATATWAIPVTWEPKP